MWILFPPVPRPNAPYWPGRRWLAALDAVAWPVAWVLVIVRVPMPMGIVGMLVIARAGPVGLSRLQRALFRNKRYRFTTWRWGRVLTALMLVGPAMRVMSTA